MTERGSASSQDHGESDSFSFRVLLGTIRRQFPHAKQLQTKLLGRWLEDDEKKKSILLLDVRAPEEHHISTLEGSLCVKSDTSDIPKIMERISEIKTATSKGSIDVICYCSLGYRSAKLAQILQEKMKAELDSDNAITIYNLEGSLFKWANERRPMVDKHGHATVFCHPYSIIWGRFLDANLRKWDP